MKDGHHHMTPDRSVENHLQGEATGPDYETQGAQAPTTNNVVNPFSEPPKMCTQYNRFHWPEQQ